MAAKKLGPSMKSPVRVTKPAAGKTIPSVGSVRTGSGVRPDGTTIAKPAGRSMPGRLQPDLERPVPTAAPRMPAAARGAPPAPAKLPVPPRNLRKPTPIPPGFVPPSQLREPSAPVGGRTISPPIQNAPGRIPLGTRLPELQKANGIPPGARVTKPTGTGPLYGERPGKPQMAGRVPPGARTTVPTGKPKAAATKPPKAAPRRRY